MIKNPASSELCEILRKSKNIAIYGLSSHPLKTSRTIADYLLSKGYNVYGVNPLVFELPGIKVYRTLTDIPVKIDIVDVFRPSESIPQIIPEVLEKKPGVLWLQLGIRNDDAVKSVIDAGITSVQNTCIKIQHKMCDFDG